MDLERISRGLGVGCLATHERDLEGARRHMGTSSPLCRTGVASARAAPAKTANTKAAPIRIVLLPTLIRTR
jgi:hypothetical protein